MHRLIRLVKELQDPVQQVRQDNVILWQSEITHPSKIAIV